ncbi:hypothetical protein NQ117_08725 [Paenibacillus sp. SC116]|uniref:hypothetical protein n=1 Tax=Paenibacillus sp. SC116 TaxID=2968986 RepID=UPI00215B357E|nr:hypothetical protein [Paenibacillus sp. SC116]MCR8843770.1 hypothetical protein [Paenibacillus sp. SC116]
MEIKRLDDKYIFSGINPEVDVQVKFLNHLMKNEKQILFEYLEPNPYYGSEEEVKENIDYFLEDYVSGTVTFQFDSTESKIEERVQHILKELKANECQQSDDYAQFSAREMLDSIINNRIKIKSEVVERIRRSIYEEIFYDLTHYYYNYASERMMYKNHYCISKDDNNAYS